MNKVYLYFFMSFLSVSFAHLIAMALMARCRFYCSVTSSVQQMSTENLSEAGVKKITDS